MSDEEAYELARQFKAAWDADDAAQFDLFAQLTTWAEARGGTLDVSAEGIVSVVINGASEQLL